MAICKLFAIKSAKIGKNSPGRAAAIKMGVWAARPRICGDDYGGKLPQPPGFAVKEIFKKVSKKFAQFKKLP